MKVPSKAEQLSTPSVNIISDDDTRVGENESVSDQERLDHYQQQEDEKEEEEEEEEGEGEVMAEQSKGDILPSTQSVTSNTTQKSEFLTHTQHNRNTVYN